MHSRNDAQYLFGVEFYVSAPPHERLPSKTVAASVAHVVIRVRFWDTIAESVMRITESLLHIPDLQSVILETLKADQSTLDAAFWPRGLHPRVRSRTWQESLGFAQSFATDPGASDAFTSDQCPPSPIWVDGELADLRKRM